MSASLRNVPIHKRNVIPNMKVFIFPFEYNTPFLQNAEQHASNADLLCDLTAIPVLRAPTYILKSYFCAEILEVYAILKSLGVMQLHRRDLIIYSSSRSNVRA
jgi:hypothetical protein